MDHKPKQCAMCRDDITNRPFIHQVSMGCHSQYGYNKSVEALLCTECAAQIRKMITKPKTWSKEMRA